MRIPPLYTVEGCVRPGSGRRERERASPAGASRAGAPGAERPLRLFVAVWLPDAVADRLRRLERPAGAGARWTRPEQWHVTLRFLGAVEPAAVEPLGRALASSLDGQPACRAALGPATARLGARTLVVPVSGLERLARAVLEATAGFGRPGRPEHTGHVTLARRAHRSRAAALASLAGVPVEAAWTVDAVALVQSRLGPGGADYRELGSFPLARGDAAAP